MKKEEKDAIMKGFIISGFSSIAFALYFGGLYLIKSFILINYGNNILTLLITLLMNPVLIISVILVIFSILLYKKNELTRDELFISTLLIYLFVGFNIGFIVFHQLENIQTNTIEVNNETIKEDCLEYIGQMKTMSISYPENQAKSTKTNISLYKDTCYNEQ